MTSWHADSTGPLDILWVLPGVGAWLDDLRQKHLARGSICLADPVRLGDGDADLPRGQDAKDRCFQSTVSQGRTCIQALHREAVCPTDSCIGGCQQRVGTVRRDSARPGARARLETRQRPTTHRFRRVRQKASPRVRGRAGRRNDAVQTSDARRPASSCVRFIHRSAKNASRASRASSLAAHRSHSRRRRDLRHLSFALLAGLGFGTRARPGRPGRVWAYVMSDLGGGSASASQRAPAGASERQRASARKCMGPWAGPAPQRTAKPASRTSGTSGPHIRNG